MFLYLFLNVTPAHGQLPPVKDSQTTAVGAVTGGGNFHFFCQYDPKYQSSSCKIAGNGCTPTSVTMAMYSLGKTQWTPPKTALAAGGAGCFDGSNIYDFANVIRSQGLKPYLGYSDNIANGTSFNYTLAKRRLAQGCYLVSAADMTYRSYGTLHRGWHATAITNVDSDNVITVYDPTFCRRDSDLEPRYIKDRRDTTTGNIVFYSWSYVRAICP